MLESHVAGVPTCSVYRPDAPTQLCYALFFEEIRYTPGHEPTEDYLKNELSSLLYGEHCSSRYTAKSHQAYISCRPRVMLPDIN